MTEINVLLFIYFLFIYIKSSVMNFIVRDDINAANEIFMYCFYLPFNSHVSHRGAQGSGCVLLFTAAGGVLCVCQTNHFFFSCKIRWSINLTFTIKKKKRHPVKLCVVVIVGVCVSHDRLLSGAPERSKSDVIQASTSRTKGKFILDWNSLSVRLAHNFGPDLMNSYWMDCYKILHRHLWSPDNVS